MKKYLAKFSNEIAYKDHFWEGKSIIPNVSLIANTGEIKYNYLEHPGVNLFDILYSDASGNLSTSSEVFDSSIGKTPIGLCIVPSGFFFPNEPARFMALKYANIDTPDTGSLEFSPITWGQYPQNDKHTIIGALPYINGYENSVYNATDVMCYDSETHTFDWDNLSFAMPGYGDNQLYVYPWDRYEGDYDPCVSLYDMNSNWNINPNIYIGNENNATVKDAGPLSLKGGAFGDINGKANTAALLAAYTAEDYRTTITKGTSGQKNTNNYIISNGYGLYDDGYSPAAACCWRYHTLGTNQGDWYLGAAGEMAMIATNLGQIQARLWEITEKYPVACFSQLDDYGYWSSSEYSSGYAFVVNLDLSEGYLCYGNKNLDYGVVPLLLW